MRSQSNRMINVDQKLTYSNWGRRAGLGFAVRFGSQVLVFPFAFWALACIQYVRETGNGGDFQLKL